MQNHLEILILTNTEIVSKKIPQILIKTKAHILIEALLLVQTNTKIVIQTNIATNNSSMRSRVVSR